MTTKENDYVKAVYRFQGESPTDLTLQVGDVVYITEVLDAQWVKGKKMGQAEEGVFPVNFVEPLKLPSFRTGQKLFFVLQNFEADQRGDLELTKGDVILGTEKVDDAWWRGKNGPLKGIFPLTFVVELELYDGPRSRSASARSNSLKSRANSLIDQPGRLQETTFARALVDVTPQLDGELGFQLGDLIEITEILDEDWMFGKCHNKEGLISSVCVELLDDGESTCEVSVNSSFEDTVQDRVQDLIRPGNRNSQNRPRTSTEGSYTSENTRSHDEEVAPYGQILFPFVAQMPGELSLEEGQIVNLIQHIDADWTEGEIDGQTGVFPSNFIEIIVDCPYVINSDEPSHNNEDLEDCELENKQNRSKEGSDAYTVDNSHKNATDKACDRQELGSNNSDLESVVTSSGITASVSGEIIISADHEIGLVCHSFKAHAEGDISVNEGDTVEVIGRVDKNWVRIQLETGEKGLVPTNHIEIIGSWLREENEVSSKEMNPEKDQSTDIEHNETVVVPKSAGQSLQPASVSEIDKSSELESDCDTHFTQDSHPSESKPSNAVPPLNRDKPFTTVTSKPPMKPKPLIAPKPTIPLKLPVIKPVHFYTAKPFTSTATRTSHVVSPTEKRNSLKLLDNLIEGEISKAKSRSSSSNSDSSNEHRGSFGSHSDGKSATLASSFSSALKHPAFTSMAVTEGGSSTSQMSSYDSSIKQEDLAAFDPVASKPDTISSIDSKPKRPMLSSAYSLSHDSNQVKFASSNKRASIAVMESGLKLLDTQSAVKTIDKAIDAGSNKSIAFTNQAFEMDVAEGNLIGQVVNSKSASPMSQISARRPPPRPQSAIFPQSFVTLPPDDTVPKKCKSPPPRPAGPRLASAPSKAPLIPVKTDDNQSKPKPVPQRPAPKAPIPVRSGPSDEKSSTVEEKIPSGTDKVASPKKQIMPVRKAPPRPVTVTVAPAPSPTQVPPTPTDLIQFSPDKSTDGGILSLSGNERNERSRLLIAQRADEEKKKKEELIQYEVEQRIRRMEHRNKIINEIVETERDYLFSLHLCLDTFLEEETPPPAGLDVDFLLGNTEEIADVSQKILLNLESNITGKDFEDQCIGVCFTATAEDMKNTYAPYCRNHDEVIEALKTYGESEEINEYLNNKVEKMMEQMNLFDVSSLLIKPVQRILKYPLLLNALLKNTEDSHQDKQEIIAAIKAMTDVAKAINEYKRRKDLVYKYKKSSDERFSDKIAKLSFHSIKKKSTRIRGRLSTNLGLGLQLKDEGFEREEAKFRSIEKGVRTFLASTNKYLEQSQEAMRYQENLVDGIVQFYKEKECVEIEKFHQVNLKLLDLYVKMRDTIEEIILTPLNALVKLFNAPSQVIGKRFDKLLDYNHQLGKGGDNEKELKATKNDYEAMNAQLMDELPKFYDITFSLLKHCMSVFVQARRDFMDQSLKESCALLELPTMISKDHMMEIFKIRHTTAFDHMSMLNFIPRGFNPKVDTVKADRARQRGGKNSISDITTPQLMPPTIPGGQGEIQRTYLYQTYPPEKLYKVILPHDANDLMDISLSSGSIVGVVKELDPMGNKDRWFVDDGAAKGFAPSNVLSKTPIPLTGTTSSDDEVLIHSYDSSKSNGSNFGSKSKRETNLMSSNSIESVPLKTIESSPTQHQQSDDAPQYYYALYDFQARHANEASLTAGSPVIVIAFQDSEGNSEWWMVDSDGNRGYAPANYMAPLPYS